MGSWDAIAAAISRATGAPFRVQSRQAVGGGCINAGYRVVDGARAYFVKLNESSRLAMFEAEAAGLEEIARSRTLRVPRPVCHGADDEASWLVLEHIELRSASQRSMRALGLGLARLHRVTAEWYGWSRDNTIGATPQVNTPSADWIAFWRVHRLGFQLRLAAENGHRGRLLGEGERLLERLPVFFAGHAPGPSLLHGDLWSGNVAFDEAGAPVVFDPAVYYGDREADLAMTELFGGFAPGFYAAYDEAYPLDPGYARRKLLYNLYHVLNHLNLFGGGYRAQAERMIGELLTQA
ncbi:MAG: fructosamine kinase family protein [Betaproteobacteria bacterium]|nr:fructosamine kinase family protein [Betaproteobacteria bacterium]